jgi:hypothetical protein
LEEEDASLRRAWGLLRQAAALVAAPVQRPGIAAAATDGLRTFRDGRQTLFHLGCRPQTTWRLAVERPQPALLVIEANPLVDRVEVDFLLNGQVVHSHRFCRNRDIDGVVVPLPLAAGENHLALAYRGGRPSSESPALFISRF